MQQCRFTGARTTDNADRLWCIDIEAGGVDGRDAAKYRVKLLDLQHALLPALLRCRSSGMYQFRCNLISFCDNQRLRGLVLLGTVGLVHLADRQEEGRR